MPILSHESTSSSFIKYLAWDSSTEILAVVFRSGSFWLYENIDVSIYDSLIHSPSVGNYFNKHIRDHYPSYKVLYTKPLYATEAKSE